MYGERALEGRRALVVGGGGGGSGRAITRAMGRAGASVAVVDIDAAAVEEAAAELVDGGMRAVAIAADVRAQSDVDRVLATTVDELGGLDVVVLVVGGFMLGAGGYARVHETTDAAWEEINDFNLDYAFRVTRAALAALLAQGTGGTLVAVSSVAARSYPLGVAYATGKAGLMSLTRTVAVEYARDGIRMNAVTLGVVETEKVRRARDTGGTFPAAVAESIPLGRWGRPEEVADAAVFLASPLSGYTTGQEIVVDGGAGVRVPLQLHGPDNLHLAG